MKMAIISFTLSEEGMGIFHDALGCISKFADEVCLEARKDKLSLSSINLSKSTYVCIDFAANRFFSAYSFQGQGQTREKFHCYLTIRALLSIFRPRIGADKDRESTVERVDVSADDGPGIKSRLIAKIFCRNGITATHALQFEVRNAVHASFREEEACNHWTISSRTLRQLMDHFGPGIELLDINVEGENVVNFTCFTEKAARTAEDATVLKKPLHTSIAVEIDEFDNIQLPEEHHIVINVKDFRNILQHAQITSGELSASYSDLGRPMRLTYHRDGVACKFILMTVLKDALPGLKTKKGVRNNQARPQLDAAAPPASDKPGVSAVGNSRPAAEASRTEPKVQQKTPVRPQRQSQFQIRPPPLPPASTLRSDSLFVTQDNDDQMWEPVNPEEDEDAEDIGRLEWDPNHNPSQGGILSYTTAGAQKTADPQQEDMAKMFESGLEPTQRLSEVRKFGLFSP